MVVLRGSAVVVVAAAVRPARQQPAGGDAPTGGVRPRARSSPASASWQVLVAGGGSLLGRVMTGPRGQLVTACASAVVVAVLAGHLLLTG